MLIKVLVLKCCHCTEAMCVLFADVAVILPHFVLQGRGSLEEWHRVGPSMTKQQLSSA